MEVRYPCDKGERAEDWGVRAERRVERRPEGMVAAPDEPEADEEAAGGLRV
ncbi:hypothetical protein [Acidiferrobacter sp.]|uniref:hypothetical protein n=1 Tax=Acidiferrobacter sp. TaxID=1872107 RepID=UPI00262D2FCB|nr:hypothetical protein [Acidiferrobacter sp.]